MPWPGLELFGAVELTPLLILLVIVIGFCAGWVDSVVGGGGLLQLPAVLLLPGITPIQALATNKMGSVFGTTTSAITYCRRVRPDAKTIAPMVVAAVLASFVGAAVASVLPAPLLKPIIVLALFVVLVFTAANKSLGVHTKLRFSGRNHYFVATLIGAAIGFYDGLLGPGTGTFLIISIVLVLGYNFVSAAAKAKVVNVATNIGALLAFLFSGHLLFGLGLMLGCANALGGYLGSRMAVARGAKFIRGVFLPVVATLILVLGAEVISEWLR